MLIVDKLAASYGPAQVLFDVSFTVAARSLVVYRKKVKRGT